MADVTPNTAQAIEFLKWRGIDVVLSAKTVQEKGNGGQFVTRAWRAPIDWDAVAKWIDQRQGKANIYYAVNPSSGAVDKKTSRADVQSMLWLHVDIDVRPGEDQVEGTKRIVGALEAYDPPPSYIVQSGGGAQGFWKLEAPVPVNGNITIAEDLKLYNLKIEQDLPCSDHCHSLDHIMRLPGTINVPNEGKRKKGRVPALAVWSKRSDVVYPLDRFKKAVVAQPEEPAGAFSDSGKYEAVRSDDKRLNGLDPKWVKIGMSGDTANEFLGTDGKTDRSKMAMAFVTACLRAKIDTQVIASILMDPSWLVGECIRDKGGETRRHLKRIIERAGKFVEEDFTKPAVLGMDTWTKNAEVFIARWFPEGLIYWRGDWWAYKAGVWQQIEDDGMRSAARKFMNESKVWQTSKVSDVEMERKQVAFNPNNNDVSELLSAARDLSYLNDKTCEQPCWIEYNGSSAWVKSTGTIDRPPPTECINLANGILHVPTRKLYPHTAEFFSASIATFDYNPTAPCVLWTRTVGEYWPEKDALEPKLLQEMMGYSLTARTDLQALFAVLGPGGSGKGTIAHVLGLLVGGSNVANLTMGALAKEFGKTTLLHKTLCIIAEAGWGRQDDRSAVTNMMKNISGEDPVSVGRKYKDDWVGKLLVRIWLFCNAIPDFDDNGKAMMRRLVTLCMTKSFAGVENKNLRVELEGELPGVLNWTLDGYDRLTRQQGNKFTEPESSTALRERFGKLASPLMGFLEDYCYVGRPPTEDKNGALIEDFERYGDLHAAYEEWCERVGMKPMSQNKFIERVVSLEPGKLKMVRKKADDGSRPWTITGIKLMRAAPVKQVGGHRKRDDFDSRKAQSEAEIPF